MEVRYILHLLLCTDQDNIRIRAKNFEIKADQFLQRCRYSILQVVQSYRNWRNINLIFHKAPHERVEGGVRSGDRGGREVDPPPGRSIARATAHSRMLSPQCGCVVELRHVEKQHLVCLEIAGATCDIR